MKRVVCWAVVTALPVVGCSFDTRDETSRVSIALSGQLEPGDIDTVDVYVYEDSRVECDLATGSIAGDTSTTAAEALGVPLSSGLVDITLGVASYDVYVEAGIGSPGAPLEHPVAQGCAQVDLNGDRTLEVLLYPYGVCGDGVIDPHEQCDDESDACEGCVTVSQWANAAEGFLNGEQSMPRAAGSGDQLLGCWRSVALGSYQLPMALYDHEGRDLMENPFRQTDATVQRDCTSIDLRGGYMIAAYAQVDDNMLNTPFFLSVWRGVTTAPSMSEGFGSTGDPPGDAAVIFTGDSFGVMVTEETDQLHMYTFRVAGTSLDLRRQNDVRATTFPQSAPALAGRRDGGFLVAWVEDESALYGRMFHRPSEPNEWHIEICGPGDACGSPAVGSVRRDAAEHFLVAYRRGHNGPIMGMWLEWTDDAETAGEPFEISAGDRCSEPAVALVEDEFIVVWTQEMGETTAVFARVVRGDREFGEMPTGTLVTAEPFRVSPEGRGACDQPAVATPRGFDGASTAMVFYRDVEGTDGQGPDIARRLIRVAREP
jgi:hypothetical protein